MEKEHIGFRVPPDTYERFQEYRGDDLSQTDAARRLLEAGLDKEESGGWLYDFLSTSGSMLAVAAVFGLLVWGGTWKVLLLALLTVATNAGAIALQEGWL